jgi:RimJ/RimL family protein N-acetyltransferase
VDPAVDLRPITEADLETVDEWFAAPHVARWWRDDRASQFLPVIRGEEATVVLIAEHDQRAVGLAQWYRWDDYPTSRDAYGIPPGTAGIDYLIGHAHDCERGLGTALVAALLRAMPELPVWVTPEEANEPSCRVLEKNGFELMAVKQCHIPDEPAAGPTALYRLTLAAGRGGAALR